ncbi:MAG: hypothetical protein J7J82_03690 [Staphylothermus sp.]|nr:hypothetical protein [Staphylothermus sp.]
MDYRYVIIGLNILAISTGFVIISILQNLEVLLGISFSVMILGVIILSIGLTYVEPLDKLYRASYRIISLLFTKILEDSDLLYGGVVKTCLGDKNLLVLSHRRVSCNDVYPGIGVVGGKVFIAIPLSMLTSSYPLEGSGNVIDEYSLESIFREKIIHEYNICKDIRVEKTGDEVKITYYGLRKEVIDLVKKPVNPLKYISIALLSVVSNREAVFKEEELVEDNYVQAIELV